MAAVTRDIPTPAGPARVHVHAAPGAADVLVLGHGAGGSVTAPDLTAVREAALGAGFTVVLVEQPYRVAGRRAPPRAPTLDASWLAVLTELGRGAQPDTGALVVGGRSSGARVACRTARAVGADAVLCLAFPLQPPARRGRPPGPGRLDELEQVDVPVLVVQGDRDPFGVPPAGPRRDVVVVPGDHTLARDLPSVAAAVGPWLVAQRDRSSASP